MENLINPQKITLDLSRKTYTIVDIAQYDRDSRILNITITDKGKPVVLDNNYKVVIKYLKTDNTFVLNDCDIKDDGTVEVIFTEQMCASDGECRGELMITKSANSADSKAKVIHTMPFIANVEKAVFPDNTVTSTYECSTLNRLISEESERVNTLIETTDTANNAIDKMNELMIDNTLVHKKDIGAANGVASLDSNTKVPLNQLYDATTSRKGIAQLVNSVSSTSNVTAATPNSVKTVYDKTVSVEESLTEKIEDEIERAKAAESDLETKKAPLANPAFTGTPKAPTASAGTNTTQIATTAFVQTAVSNGIAASDALIFKGTIGTNGTITTLPTTYKTGWTYRVITAGTYAGQVCEIGDLIVALVDRNGSGNVNSDWCVAQTNINGAITGIKSGDAYITVSQSGSVVTITHKDITRTNTTSTVSPSNGGTFTSVKSVTSDSKGHVTGIDTETIKLPTYTSLKNPYAIDINGTTYDGSHNVDIDLLPFVVGTQTAATGTWTGNASSISALFDGLTIRYWLPYNGSGNATLNLTLKDGSTTGAINCYYGGTTRLTTHYSAGNVIELTYRENVSIAGSSTTYTGWWAKANYDSGNTRNTAGSTDSSAKLFLIGAASQTTNPVTYSHDTAYIGTDGCLYSGGKKVLTSITEDNIVEALGYTPGTSTDTKVTNSLATTTKAYVTGTTSASTNTGTQIFDTGVYLDTTAGMLTATTFKGNLSGNASTASSATQVYGTLTNPASATNYYIPFHATASSANKALRNNNGIFYRTLEGTEDTNGYGLLCLGNNTATGTSGNKYGGILAYGTGAYYTQLAFGAQTANRTITFPNASGTVALTSNINQYIDSNIHSHNVQLGFGNTTSATQSGTVSGGNSVCIGINNTAGAGQYSSAFCIGYENSATSTKDADGNNRICMGCIGTKNTITNTSNSSTSIAIGAGNDLSSTSIAIGYDNHLSQVNAISIGSGNTNTGYHTMSFGTYNTSSGGYNYTIGHNNTNKGSYAIAAGYHITLTGENQFGIGHYNVSNSSSTSSGASIDTVFIIGNGTSSTSSNAFRVQYDGKVYAKGAYSASGADYAEYFEWEDKNIANEDRRGRFVTFGNDSKIKEATSDDSYILGIVSAKPVIIGNVDDDEWNNKYLKDEFGNFIMEEYEEEYEEVEYEEIIDQETGETQAVEKPITKTRIVTHYKINPEYDESQTYKPRSQRPEWSPIGLLGVLVARDDGTCVIGGYCKPSNNGIATSATTEEYNSSKNVYKVLERVNDNLIKIFFK